MEIKIAAGREDFEKCRESLIALRPHLSQEQFLPTLEEMSREGYQLAFIQEDNIAAAVIGFRYLQHLYNGKHYYIDDLSTLSRYRGRGYAAKLLDFVCDMARVAGFKTVTLDSGYQRRDAHRLYLNQGFTLDCHHFSKTL